MGLVNLMRTEHEVFSQNKELYAKCIILQEQKVLEEQMNVQGMSQQERKMF